MQSLTAITLEVEGNSYCSSSASPPSSRLGLAFHLDKPYWLKFVRVEKHPSSALQVLITRAQHSLALSASSLASHLSQTHSFHSRAAINTFRLPSMACWPVARPLYFSLKAGGMLCRSTNSNYFGQEGISVPEALGLPCTSLCFKVIFYEFTHPSVGSSITARALR